MTSEATVRPNTQIVRDYTRRVFNDHAPDLASEYLAHEVKWHGATLGTVEGLDNVTELLRGFIAALPDLHAAEQDLVAAATRSPCVSSSRRRTREICSGSSRPAAGCAGTRVDVYRLADGMIVEEWAADDFAAILHQVGAYTPPWLS
jgi:predicted SnoaL-like aldol condensation-catalyzing enzyme